MHFLPPNRTQDNLFILEREREMKAHQNKGIKSNVSTCLLAYTNGSSSIAFSSEGVTLTFPATAIPFFASCQKEL